MPMLNTNLNNNHAVPSIFKLNDTLNTNDSDSDYIVYYKIKMI